VAVTAWLLDQSAAAPANDVATREQLDELAGFVYLCPVGELEKLYSARSACDYDALKAELHATFDVVVPPADILRPSAPPRCFSTV
jgi:hypothetical protein